MSREVRRVPMDYQHPRCLVPDHQHGGLRVAFVPLFPGERYMESLTEFRSDPADWDFEPPRFDARGDLMTDWRAWEVESTLDEARAAEVAGWGWLAVALVLVVAAGAAEADGLRVTSLVLAVWECWPLWLAVSRWARAVDDREGAAWMEGRAGRAQRC